MNRNIFSPLKLEITLAIPAVIELKIEVNSSAEHVFLEKVVDHQLCILS